MLHPWIFSSWAMPPLKLWQARQKIIACGPINLVVLRMKGPLMQRPAFPEKINSVFLYESPCFRETKF